MSEDVVGPSPPARQTRAVYLNQLVEPRSTPRDGTPSQPPSQTSRVGCPLTRKPRRSDCHVLYFRSGFQSARHVLSSQAPAGDGGQLSRPVTAETGLAAVGGVALIFLNMGCGLPKTKTGRITGVATRRNALRRAIAAGKWTVTATFYPTTVSADVGRRPLAGDRQAYGERSLIAFSLSRIFSRPRSFSVLTLRRGISSASSASPATAEMLSSRSRCSIG